MEEIPLSTTSTAVPDEPTEKPAHFVMVESLENMQDIQKEINSIKLELENLQKLIQNQNTEIQGTKSLTSFEQHLMMLGVPFLIVMSILFIMQFSEVDLYHTPIVTDIITCIICCFCGFTIGYMIFDPEVQEEGEFLIRQLANCCKCFGRIVSFLMLTEMAEIEDTDVEGESDDIEDNIETREDDVDENNNKQVEANEDDKDENAEYSTSNES